ncbi:MAG: hypothetical protein KGN36_00435, partial [Acidobacteriota bacterium]|nr:hypothetical protein [Acidobacteriota bacterium]
GTIAWAIPAMYATDGQMIPVHKAVGEITNWPELSLMQEEGWATLRLDFTLSAGVALALDSYAAGIEELAKLADSALVESLKDVAGVLGETAAAMQALERHQVSAAEATKQITANNTRMLVIRADASERLRKLVLAQTTLSGRFENLHTEVKSFQARLPGTPRNRERIALADRDTVTVALQLFQGGTALAQLQTDFMAKLSRIVKRLEGAHSNREIRRLIVEEQTLMTEAAGNNARKLTPIVTSYRAIGNIAESLLDTADTAPRPAGGG